MNKNKFEDLQQIAREQGKFLSKCAKNSQYPDRKYMIGKEFFSSLRMVRINLGLEEWDGVPDNIK